MCIYIRVTCSDLYLLSMRRNTNISKLYSASVIQLHTRPHMQQSHAQVYNRRADPRLQGCKVQCDQLEVSRGAKECGNIHKKAFFFSLLLLLLSLPVNE